MVDLYSHTFIQIFKASIYKLYKYFWYLLMFSKKDI